MPAAEWLSKRRKPDAESAAGPRVLVVGGGFGGLSAVAALGALRRAGDAG